MIVPKRVCAWRRWPAWQWVGVVQKQRSSLCASSCQSRACLLEVPKPHFLVGSHTWEFQCLSLTFSAVSWSPPLKPYPFHLHHIFQGKNRMLAEANGTKGFFHTQKTVLSGKKPHFWNMTKNSWRQRVAVKNTDSEAGKTLASPIRAPRFTPQLQLLISASC